MQVCQNVFIILKHFGHVLLGREIYIFCPFTGEELCNNGKLTRHDVHVVHKTIPNIV